MKISELCRVLDADIQAEGDPEIDIATVTAGDLLSFVMGAAPVGAVWVTIQIHLNVAAVAVLKELPMIIIASGRKPAPDLVARCEEEKICVVSVKETIFAVCAKLAGLGMKE